MVSTLSGAVSTVRTIMSSFDAMPLGWGTSP
jgi:hypothetical protein